MKELEKIIFENFQKEIEDCSLKEVYTALLLFTKKKLKDKGCRQGKKKVYYISAEFLTGKLLSNNLINLGLYDSVEAYLKEHKLSLAQLEQEEPEPSLGNGGLGRLAACFLDSIATLGINGEGIGLNYHLGLFRQKFSEHMQKELPDPWIEEKSWLTRQENSYTVPFSKFSLKSTLYDMDVSGYENLPIKLRLFDFDLADDSIIGQGINFNKKDILHNLTLFLYPDDSDDEGRKLRIYQQYFMVSNAAQLILEEACKRGCKLYDLYDYAAIQINDTHPSLVIPELIRLLSEKGIDFDKACQIVSKVCAYTNHTILAEALEKWPLSYLEEVVPHLLPIIRKLDEKMKALYPDPEVAIIDERDFIHMAHMDIHYGHSINGVAKLHTDILKYSELSSFYAIYPEKFNNKTNGITFRRWLLHCNRNLSNLLTETIGDSYKKNATDLERLLEKRENEYFLNELLAVKQEAKRICADFLRENTKVSVDEKSIFDIQIKRLHEYKRQQLNALYIIHKYFEIKSGILPKHPITFIFGAKAAPAYRIAKDIIHLILCLQRLINTDKEVSPYIKVLMVENYNVSAAEKLIPACDISEQISLASKEASGTGNMKFMLNGAITLGTMDGANVEICDLVGRENIYIFGKDSATVIDHYEKADYCARELYEEDSDIKACLDFIISSQMTSIGNKECLYRLYEEILNKDWFMTLLDFKDYVRAKEKAFADYDDRKAWAKKMLVNIAKAGYFSSDRTIEQYNKDIWHLD